ncbi:MULTISPECIES: heme oxygenase (biliverdin-producing) [unclassified Streptomyces]|uniref:biliverdin-producing heme oxygenase n=1 Tax=unclassified Streptomyces TaxID=2593676 RepID=UPI002DDA4F38|nr:MULTISPECIES: biliverdin-producing heme oxygenase [unclassified Streptomyces]WSF87084.1 biliverdin-producing heme oxygenase [Streptomyces sp. NBC_01744]WSC36674.1 biliverdin-producing heme oxygenase [Streptomyces sp. NBC_01763]WSC44771.1 biliverdin-producing heme oxygenase [Streptomyces sp. NBC_01762]WSC56247.1 biliverdin-producing heme oxygenase [Streptomyces sp. NBC_01761]WSD24358.1 biliverdin-producing heme oxygenase [Streptomyces sp. NBC_01751]
MDATAATTPFSTLIRTASHEQHTEAETSTFMSDLLGGRLGVVAYTRYTEQLWFVYRALEEGAQALRTDPVAGPFIRPELMRTAELERDLAHLRGADWRRGLEPLPATAAYADRVTECARTWSAGYIAHHYTRYLGDLSGGQIIRDRAEKTWGFARKGDGVRFYVFEEIANPASFKRGYRELLDAVEADELEKMRIVDECRRAFALNTAVFRELGEVFPRSA